MEGFARLYARNGVNEVERQPAFSLHYSAHLARRIGGRSMEPTDRGWWPRADAALGHPSIARLVAAAPTARSSCGIR